MTKKRRFSLCRSKTYRFTYSLNGCASVNDWSSSAIRNNSLYLATRSVRDSDPVLICPQPRPTAKWLIVVSSEMCIRDRSKDDKKSDKDEPVEGEVVDEK